MSEEQAVYETKEKGYVYLATPEGKNIHKIGASNDIPRRMKAYERKKDFKLVVVDKYFSDHYFWLEARLHDFYSKRRLAGEWFYLTDKEVSDFTKTAKRIERTYKR